MNYLSLFSGIGAPEKALSNLGINYELINYCEIDPSAAHSYAAIHGVPKAKNLGDITKVDVSTLPTDISLLTYGFPCQDISICGKQKGLFNENGGLTRSGLFFDALRIIHATKPKVAIAENVKNLVAKKFAPQFSIISDALSLAGYNNYWAVVNSANDGLPQDRERVFIVSIRSDVDPGGFTFPEKVSLQATLGDFMERDVSCGYYLTDTQIERIQNWKAQQRPFKRVLGRASICPTLTARGAGEYHSGMILYSDQLDDTQNCDRENLRNDIRYRVLTERECFRLMGFTDDDFEKASAVSSKRNLYKQAGNSIAVPTIERILQAVAVYLPCAFANDPGVKGVA